MSRGAPEIDLPPAPGGFLTVDGHNVHVLFDGPDETDVTVVFESALGCPCTEWAHVQRRLADQAIRSIAYDRPGLGWSSDIQPPEYPPEHGARLAAILRQLTRRQVVLVGHSVGGLLSLLFWQAHPKAVAGLVLVDASHPAQHIRSSRQREGLRSMREQLRQARRSHGAIPLEGDVTHLPRPLDQYTHAAATGAKATRATLREIDAWQSTWAPAAAKITDLGDLPLVVITAGNVERRDPAHSVLQRELAGLSSRARHIVVDGATHQGLVMHADSANRIAAEIAELVRKR